MLGRRCHRASRGGWTQARLPAQHVPRVSRLSLCLSQRIGLCGRWVEADGTRRRKGGWAWGWVVLGEQVVLVGAAPCAEVREGACCPTRREGVNWSPPRSWSQHFHVISFNPLQRP